LTISILGEEFVWSKILKIKARPSRRREFVQSTVHARLVAYFAVIGRYFPNIPIEVLPIYPYTSIRWSLAIAVAVEVDFVESRLHAGSGSATNEKYGCGKSGETPPEETHLPCEGTLG
jgi:hypothetical protein